VHGMSLVQIAHCGALVVSNHGVPATDRPQIDLLYVELKHDNHSTNPVSIASGRKRMVEHSASRSVLSVDVDPTAFSLLHLREGLITFRT
jgi:hypothetical protein